MPVMISVMPVMMPALCSNACQLSFSSPLYARDTSHVIPAAVITTYIIAITTTNQLDWVPAIKK
ncbi:DUF2673 domain-containing protein [Sediminibacterium sp.]|uniref:DUF2673 domain-containing protein n=1 Tax=Sediminibacterium sp. TaxID=1917865 RepID=UPI00351FF3B7